MRIKKLILENINSLYGKWEIDFDCKHSVKAEFLPSPAKPAAEKLRSWMPFVWRSMQLLRASVRAAVSMQ